MRVPAQLGVESQAGFQDGLKVQLSLIGKYFAMGNVGSQGLEVDLQGCTALGVRCENGTPCSCSVHILCKCMCGPAE